MKKVIGLFCLVSLVLTFSACKKRDVHVVDGKLSKCDVASATDLGQTLFPRSGAFTKTYFPNGYPKTLNTIVYKGFLNVVVDSLYYEFAYTGNTVQVKLKVVPYHYIANDSGDMIYVPNGSPRNETFQVVIDEKNGWATSAKGQTFTYKNGRLDVPYLKYDSKGNIIEDTRNLRTVYEYDYSKTAKQQFYYSSAKDETFTLLELMGWIPVAPTNLLTRVLITDQVVSGKETYVYNREVISNHNLDKNGFLTSFSASSSFETIYVNYNCTPVKLK